MTDDTETAQHKRAHSFRQVILTRTRAGIDRTKRLWRSAWSWTAKSTGTAGHAVAWAVLGSLGVIGKTLLYVGQMAGSLVILVIGVVVGAVILLLAGIGWLAINAVYFGWNLLLVVIYAGIKVVHFVALVIATPWLAYRGSREAVRTDWLIFRTSLRPKNWFVIDPTALALRTMDERSDTDGLFSPNGDAPQDQQRMTTAASDGQKPPRPGRNTTQPKDHATARQRPRPVSRLDPGTAPV